MVTDDRPYIQVNDRERGRLRELVDMLDDDALEAPARAASRSARFALVAVPPGWRSSLIPMHP